MSLYRSKEFLALKAEWDAKLKASGFEDAEERDGLNLKTSATSKAEKFARKYDADRWNLKAEYYQSAGRFLHDYQFDNPLEEAVWKLHAEGCGVREIVTRLNHPHVRSKWKAHQIVQKLAKIMVQKWRE